MSTKKLSFLFVVMHKIEEAGVLERCADDLVQLGDRSASTEALALDAVNYLYNELSEGEGEPCALVRFFRTIQFTDLTAHLRKLVQESLGDVPDGTNCLTLLASRGSQKAWNNRFQSAGHQVIPLISSRMIEEAPMIAQLLKRLGIDIGQVIEPSPKLFLDPKKKNYNVMYVPEAEGDPAIVAQTQFVIPQGIRSVIGFGGLLPSGEMFAVVMFMRVFISEQTAKRFELLARALEQSITKLPREHQRAEILLADEEHSLVRLQNLFGSRHEITLVTTISEAEKAIQKTTYDLIVCGTRFDESRMFDLLKTVKQNKNLKPKPFICFKQNPMAIGKDFDSGVPMTAKLIGAACYLDGTIMSDSDLKIAIDAYLPKDIWMSRTNGH